MKREEKERKWRVRKLVAYCTFSNCPHVVLIMPSCFQFLFSQEERGDESSSEDEARAKDDKASESESESSEEGSEEEAVLSYMFLTSVNYYNVNCRCYLNLHNDKI